MSTLGPCFSYFVVSPSLSIPRDIEILIGIRNLSDKICPYSEVDTAFFVLTVDLWSADGKREVNLVRHSATSPSISAATSSSYPPRPPTPPYQPNGSSAPNSAHPFSMQHQQWNHGHQLPPQQSPTHPAQYGFGVGNPNYHLYRTPQPLPPPSQPQYQQAQPQYHPNQHYPPQHQQQAYYTAPSANGMAYYTQQPPAQGPLLTPDQMQPQGGQQPAGMFTRNLIGSLCVSAFKLTDCDAQTGVWFILQDLSVRTEGTFRYAYLHHFPHAPVLARLLILYLPDFLLSCHSQKRLRTVILFAESPVPQFLLTSFAAG